MLKYYLRFIVRVFNKTFGIFLTDDLHETNRLCIPYRPLLQDRDLIRIKISMLFYVK